MRLSEMQRLSWFVRDLTMKATGSGHQRALSAGTFAVAEDIVAYSPVTISDITRRTQLAQSFVSRTVRHLADVGYVTVSVSPEDRRKTTVSINRSTGLDDIRQRSNQLVGQTLRELYPERSAAELAELEAALERLYRLLEH